MIVPAKGASAAEHMAALDWEERWAAIERLIDERGPEFETFWDFWARERQKIRDLDWRVLLHLGGRGCGKTRVGAEWVRRIVLLNGSARIALVAATMAEARAVMVEGESGLLAVCAGDERPKWEPSLARLTWPNGARATLFSAAEPDSLRGPQHHAAWADEIAKWPEGIKAWDNLTLGVRKGERPQVVATTTPRPVPLIRRLRNEPGVRTMSGRTADNHLHLAESFVGQVTELYGGTRLGRQELDGELIEDFEGALWTREGNELGRASAVIARSAATKQSSNDEAGLLRFARDDEMVFSRVVVGVDPPASASGDACGIVACGLGADGIGYVLDDRSVRGLSPEGWAREVVRAAEIWQADLVVVETNQGGEMVESVLRSVDSALPVRPVRARYGKGRRAEPVSALFARGKASFAGIFAELEDQLCGMTGSGYEGPGRSPDRADAMVWAMAELLLGERAEPRIRRL
jgi:phage terminase large subunit-like protein